MFNFFKKKQNNTYMLGAVAKGKAVELKEVNDPTFNSGMLGQGVAIVPSEGKSMHRQMERSRWYLRHFMQSA